MVRSVGPAQIVIPARIELAVAGSSTHYISSEHLIGHSWLGTTVDNWKRLNLMPMIEQESLQGF